MDSQKIGKFICQLRKEQHLTQAVLAEKLNISNRTVSKWENGDGLPDIAILPYLAKALNVTIDELLNGEKHAKGFSDLKVTEVENKDNIDNIFQITYIIALFFGIFSTILGTVTEIYSIWAFNILFYTHWEIMFVAVAFCALIACLLVFAIGTTRLGVSYTKKQIIDKVSKKAWWLGAITALFPMSFIIRIADCSSLHRFVPALSAVLIIIYIITSALLYKKIYTSKI